MARRIGPRKDALRRVASCLLAAAMLGDPTVVLAAPASPPPPAVERFARGKAQYDRGEFVAAAKAWDEAMRMLPDQGFARARIRMALDVSTAMERQFDKTGDKKSLTRARDFVAWYGKEVESVYTDPEERARERARATDRLARIDGKVALQASQGPGRKKEVDLEDFDDGAEADKRLKRKHRGMIAGGAVLTVVGVGGLGMIAAGGLTDRKWLMGLGAGVAIVFGIIGPVMIGFGIRRRRAALSSLDRTPRVGVMADRGAGGLTLGGRF